jgi:hypothetical protein
MPQQMPQQMPNKKPDLLNNFDKTFEKEMDNLIGSTSMNDINSSNTSFYNNKTYIKFLALIVLLYIISNVKLLVIFRNFIPEQVYEKIIDNEKYIYYLIFGIIVYTLYKYEYI